MQLSWIIIILQQKVILTLLFGRQLNLMVNCIVIDQFENPSYFFLKQ